MSKLNKVKIATIKTYIPYDGSQETTVIINHTDESIKDGDIYLKDK